MPDIRDITGLRNALDATGKELLGLYRAAEKPNKLLSSLKAQGQGAQDLLKYTTHLEKQWSSLFRQLERSGKVQEQVNKHFGMTAENVKQATTQVGLLSRMLTTGGLIVGGLTLAARALHNMSMETLQLGNASKSVGLTIKQFDNLSQGLEIAGKTSAQAQKSLLDVAGRVRELGERKFGSPLIKQLEQLGAWGQRLIDVNIRTYETTGSVEKSMLSVLEVIKTMPDFLQDAALGMYGMDRSYLDISETMKKTIPVTRLSAEEARKVAEAWKLVTVTMTNWYNTVANEVVKKMADLIRSVQDAQKEIDRLNKPEPERESVRGMTGEDIDIILKKRSQQRKLGLVRQFQWQDLAWALGGKPGAVSPEDAAEAERLQREGIVPRRGQPINVPMPAARPGIIDIQAGIAATRQIDLIAGQQRAGQKELGYHDLPWQLRSQKEAQRKIMEKAEQAAEQERARAGGGGKASLWHRLFGARGGSDMDEMSSVARDVKAQELVDTEKESSKTLIDIRDILQRMEGGGIGGGAGGPTFRRGVGPGARGAAGAGALQGPQGAEQLQKELGINPGEYNAFRQGMADIESSGGKYGLTGGAGGRYSGAYQFGPAEIEETAKQLGEKPPTREQFLADPAMQERYMSAYTLKHHQQLMQHPKYAAMSPREKLAVLGYAHNQGVGSRERGTGAMGYLDTGKVGRDAWGTAGTTYGSAIQRRLGELDRGGTPGAGLTAPPGAGAGAITHTGSGRMVPEELQRQMQYAGLVAGVRTDIAAGMEPGHARHRPGAPAADVDFYDPVTGAKLDVRNPKDQAKMAAYVEAAAAAGATGIGFGKGGSYMGFSRMHVGGGRPGVWGAGGSGGTAPEWLTEAYKRGRARAMSPQQVMEETKRLQDAQAERANIDKSIAPPRKLGSADLNVNVNGAKGGPSGAVKSDSIFNKVSIDRTPQMPLPSGVSRNFALGLGTSSGRTWDE